MSKEKTPGDRHLAWAACAVAVATAVSGPSLAPASELQTLEQLQKYCTASWRNAGINSQDWPDCTQQAVMELLERISRTELAEAIGNRESAERRELNRSVWRTIQRWRRSPRSLPFEEPHAGRGAKTLTTAPSDDVWDEVMSTAQRELSPRQTRILAMTRDGWRVREIADALALTPARVSDEKYKAIYKLRRHFEMDA